MASIELTNNSMIEDNKESVYFIAEIGQNHQGDLDVAKRMIIAAKEAGCNCVKFQKSCLAEKFTEFALNRVYAGKNSWGRTYGEHKKYLEFTLDQYKELQEYCKQIEIDFTASAMDEVSLQQLDELNVPFIKIGSGDANNFPMLQKASLLSRPLVISTGMQSIESIERIVSIMSTANKSNYALMHCVSAYPTQPLDANILMISILKEKFPNTIIGYSGHELGIDITKAAILLGARIVERHFTLDKTQKGSDHVCSLNPQEMQQMVEEVRVLASGDYLMHSDYDPEVIIQICKDSDDVRLALSRSQPNKGVQPCELSCKQKLGKSIVARRDLCAGHKISSDDVCIKVSEPNGIPGENYYEVLNTALKCAVKQDEPILFDYIITV